MSFLRTKDDNLMLLILGLLLTIQTISGVENLSKMTLDKHFINIIPEFFPLKIRNLAEEKKEFEK